MTVKALERMRVPYHIVVEAEQYEDYAAVIDQENILVLDKAYQDNYDTCDDLGARKSKGPGAARNFVWDHAISQGHDWHWVMDDNIERFERLAHNLKVPVWDGVVFACMEDFVQRYTNVLMAGPNYDYFAKRKQIIPPFKTNTRIYSCNLIRNDAPYRWRGRYNEDTDLSLRMLKDGWCTIQFNAFLQCKTPTQIMSGGNTADFYAEEGTYPKSAMQVRLHPDVSRLVWKFGRVHHLVDYRPFLKNRLRKREDIDIPSGSNEYGMELFKAGEKVLVG